MLLDTPTAELGWQAPSFTLADPDGRAFSLADLQGEKGFVIAFISNHCPFVQAMIARFVADAKTLKAEGVNVVAIMPNDYRSVAADSPAVMKQFAAHFGFSFPYLVDEDQSVARAYGAVCTPDLFGFNAAGELQYRDRLDDDPMGQSDHRTPELLEAMQLIAATGQGPDDQVPSMGCSIKWR